MEVAGEVDEVCSKSAVSGVALEAAESYIASQQGGGAADAGAPAPVDGGDGARRLSHPFNARRRSTSTSRGLRHARQATVQGSRMAGEKRLAKWRSGPRVNIGWGANATGGASARSAETSVGVWAGRMVHGRQVAGGCEGEGEACGVSSRSRLGNGPGRSRRADAHRLRCAATGSPAWPICGGRARKIAVVFEVLHGWRAGRGQRGVVAPAVLGCGGGAAGWLELGERGLAPG